MGLEVRCRLLRTAGSCERCILSWEVHIFGHEVFFRMYLPLERKVDELVNCCLGFEVVTKLKKHLLGLTQSKYSP